MEAFFLVALIILWLASAGFSGWLADVKGRHGPLWFLWGLLFGIAALITIAGAPPAPKRSQRQCPQCDESISVKALICHWCGMPQPSQASTSAPYAAEQDTTTSRAYPRHWMDI